MASVLIAALPALVSAPACGIAAAAQAGSTTHPAQAPTPAPGSHPAQAPKGSSGAGGAGAVHGDPQIRSNVALVIDAALGTPLYSKHKDQVAPIASITKLMTAMVVLDAALPPDEPVILDKADVDHMKNTRSRLPVGAVIARGDLLRVALMSSDNRAAAALARTYPGGTAACVSAMNRKAIALGMTRTSFADPTGLSSLNVSNAEDLTRLVLAASAYAPIREATTSFDHRLTLGDGRVLEFHNSNGLVRNPAWSIGLSKTGYINEAGRCLVMQAEIAAKQVVIVLLDSWGKYTRLGDANRIRHWLEGAAARAGAGASAPAAAVEVPAVASSSGP
ncbi:MAG TPA: D-alanyl-D-alanine endopeptidase [Candidatus Polarisedimenticolia bacterium]|nr:D-alanyl-D-alanine endopeptidase [Candidatus Polarisedimenticolia bacterium]